MTPQERATAINAIRHEAGHLIVARHLCFRTTEIVLHDEEAGAAVDLKPSISSIEDALTFIEKRVKILLGGAGAESLRNGQIDSGHAEWLLEKHTAKNDWAKVRELLRLAGGMRKPGVTQAEFETEVTLIKDKWTKETGEIIEANVAIIEQFVEYFMDKLDNYARRNKLKNVSGFKLSEKQIEAFFEGKSLAQLSPP